jgi:hypothetical protein
LHRAEGIKRRGIDAVFAPAMIPGSVAFPREVQHAAFLAATQCGRCLQLAEQQRIIACKLVAIDVQRVHAAE